MKQLVCDTKKGDTMGKLVSNKTQYLVEFSPRERELTARVTSVAPCWHSAVAGWYERGTRRQLLFEPLDLASQLLHSNTTYGRVLN